jgi:signal peptidase I
MSASQVYLVVLGLILISAIALPLTTLKWGLERAGVVDISFLKAFGILLLIFVGTGIVSFVIELILLVLHVKMPELVSYSIAIPNQTIVAWLIVAAIYKIRPRQAAKAIVPFMVAVIAVPAFTYFVVRSFVYESFAIPTNAMAPTLLGDHWKSACPNCGKHAYGSLSDRRTHSAPKGFPMVCSNEFTQVFVAGPPGGGGEGDRITACKLLAPRRWDLIVFRYPADPSVTYVKRLVGLPGEHLEIRDGAVWINGEKLEPPEAIRGIPYSPNIEANGQVFAGPGSSPVTLGSNEYFVLGDFVAQSSDSRFWEMGAHGHPPYAVPAENIIGVVIHIYWPISRWASFR